MNEYPDGSNAGVPAGARDGATFAYQPEFALYHANASGTGCAMKIELHPATGEEDGCFMLKLANQLTASDMRGPVKRFATFNWAKRITVKLGFSDICKMLQVFRGECESIDDGKGLYHRSAKRSTKIVLRHMISPIQAYSLEVYRNSSDGSEEDASSHIMLSTAEAYGLAVALENSIGLICFGVPSGVGRACVAVKGSRDVSAA